MAKWTYSITSINRVKEKPGVLTVTATLLKNGVWITDREFTLNFSDLTAIPDPLPGRRGKTLKDDLKIFIKEKFSGFVAEEEFLDDMKKDLDTKAEEGV